MTPLAVVLLALIVNAVLLSAYALTSLSRAGWRLWGGPVGVLLMISIFCGSTFLSLGTPRPITVSPLLNMLVWGPVPSEERYILLGASFDEGVAIYAWLQPKSGGAPIAIVLPWSQAEAESLNSKMMEAEQEGSQIEIDGAALRGYEGFDTNEPTFQAPPPPPMPPKNGS